MHKASADYLLLIPQGGTRPAPILECMPAHWQPIAEEGTEEGAEHQQNLYHIMEDGAELNESKGQKDKNYLETFAIIGGKYAKICENLIKSEENL